MIPKMLRQKIDKAIKDVWLNEIRADYAEGRLLKEASLQCSMYHHLRSKLEPDLQKYDLYLYPEFYVRELRYFADLAIVRADRSLEGASLSDRITDIAAVIELKYGGGYAKSTSDYIKSDIWKLKDYVKNLPYAPQYYFGVIYETECYWLHWADKRTSDNWGRGCLTELNAGLLDGRMYFEVNSYNDLNYQTKQKPCDVRW